MKTAAIPRVIRILTIVHWGSTDSQPYPSFVSLIIWVAQFSQRIMCLRILIAQRFFLHILPPIERGMQLQSLLAFCTKSPASHALRSPLASTQLNGMYMHHELCLKGHCADAPHCTSRLALSVAREAWTESLIWAQLFARLICVLFEFGISVMSEGGFRISDICVSTVSLFFYGFPG